MSSSYFFLDTNVCIDRIFGKKSILQKLKSADLLYTSTYVVGEFIRTIVSDCCVLHSIVLEEDNLNDVYRRISVMTESGERNKVRKGQRYNLLLRSLGYPGKPNKEKALINLSMYIRFSLIPSFVSGLTIIESKTKCELVSYKPKRYDGHFKINIPCVENSGIDQCSLSNLICKSVNILKSISNELESESESYYIELRRVIENHLDHSELVTTYDECKIFGDVIVTADCPNDCTTVSRDHHLEKICDIAGQSFMILD
ncbi:hypothetical protein BMS3Bbin15_00066 [archaeon BMS3Bbin15]|nr:hypothetical protein BMS3Bbin15_00066 [archaeon BMS3Bbin15]